MKKIISMMLVVCIALVSIAAYAEPVASANNIRDTQNLRVNIDDIERLVRQNNPTVRNNRITEDGLNEVISDNTFNMLMSSQNQLAQMQNHTRGVLAQIMAVQPDEPDPVREGIIMSLMNDIAANERDIMQISSQMDQVQGVRNRSQISRTQMQLSHANRQITWGVESLFLGYHTLIRQLEQTRENLSMLNDNIAIMERRHAVGHITARQLQNVRSSRTQLEAAIVSMENELDNLMGQMNIMLGRSVDATITMGRLPAAERGFLDTVDRDRDLAMAKRNNHVMNMAMSEISEVASQWSESARRTEAMAQNNFDNETRAVLQRYESLTRAIADRERTLELAEQQLELLKDALEETERRLSRGLASRIEVEQARSEVALQEIRISSADAELFGTIRRYEWLIRGLSV
jgi:hypothetical protein